jgi:hypothetical protein
MSDRVEEITDVLHDAAETHHVVFAIVDGEDADWASWYADWLLRLSKLPDLLGVTPVRSALVYMLVSCDKDYVRDAPPERWETYYARRLLEAFAA